jgi:hypothetical protein
MNRSRWQFRKGSVIHYDFFNLFLKINSKSNSVAFLFSNLTCLAMPKHAIAPHASARHDLPRRTTISMQKSLPRHSRWRE